MTLPDDALPRPRPITARHALLLPVTALALLLGGCAEAEQIARSAAEDAARDAVAEATGAAGGVVEDAAREQAQAAVDSALEQLPGTCADVVALPAATRDEQAEAVLRGFWLGELTTADPPAETVDAYASAVVDACEDARETEASVVLREVWESGAYAP
jgi:hypothetical protein